MANIGTWKDVPTEIEGFLLAKQLKIKIASKRKQVSIHAAIESLIKTHPEFIEYKKQNK